MLDKLDEARQVGLSQARAIELLDRIETQCRAVGHPVGGIDELKYIIRAALTRAPAQVTGTQPKEALNNVITAWDKYMADCRLEKRNEFLMAWGQNIAFFRPDESALQTAQPTLSIKDMTDRMVAIQNAGIETLIRTYLETTGCSINDVQLSQETEADGKTSWCVEPKSYREQPASDLVEQEALNDMAASLELAKGIFAHYADLHSTKGTEDGKAKAYANLQHANSIAVILKKHADIIRISRGEGK